MRVEFHSSRVWVYLPGFHLSPELKMLAVRNTSVSVEKKAFADPENKYGRTNFILIGEPSQFPSLMSLVMAVWSRVAVLNLYRALLREGRNLQYTDRDYYYTLIKREFRKNQHLTKEEEKIKQLEKGIYFLKSKLGGLV